MACSRPRPRDGHGRPATSCQCPITYGDLQQTAYHVGTDRNGEMYPLVSQPTRTRLKEIRSSSHRPTACCVPIVTPPLLISGLLVTACPQCSDAILSTASKSNVFQQRYGPPLRRDDVLEPATCTSLASDQLNISSRHHPPILSTLTVCNPAPAHLGAFKFPAPCLIYGALFESTRLRLDDPVDEAIRCRGSLSYVPRAG